MKRASALVTGAAGFIGAGVAAALQAGLGDDAVVGHDLAALDAAAMRGAAWVQGDVAAIGRDAPSGLAPSAVVHAAGITTAACERDPDAAYRVNVEGTRALLAWCRSLPQPPRFIFTSSVAVFGGGETLVDEQSLVCPRLTYGATKAAAEQLVLDAARRGEIDGVVVRLPITIIRTSRVGRPGAGYLSDLALHACAGRPFEAPLGADHVLPVASSAATFALLARLADPALALPAAIIHVPSIATSGAAMVEALAARGFRADVVFRPDHAVEALIRGWPHRLKSRFEGSYPIGSPLSLTEILETTMAQLSPASM